MARGGQIDKYGVHAPPVAFFHFARELAAEAEGACGARG